MKIKVSEATEIQLDWMVAKAAGHTSNEFQFPNGTPTLEVVIDGNVPYDMRYGNVFRPSTNWSQGGPIIERERINLNQCGSSSPGGKMHWFWEALCGYENESGHTMVSGPTPLIAAMRCYVASKLGDEVEVPEELT